MGKWRFVSFFGLPHQPPVDAHMTCMSIFNLIEKPKSLVEEMGPHVNLTSSGGACVAALHTQRPKVTTRDGLKLKLTN